MTSLEIAALLACLLTGSFGLFAGYNLGRADRYRHYRRLRGDRELTRALLACQQQELVALRRLVREHGLTLVQGVDGEDRLEPTSELPTF